jgi:hypothetical protein
VRRPDLVVERDIWRQGEVGTTSTCSCVLSRAWAWVAHHINQVVGCIPGGIVHMVSAFAKASWHWLHDWDSTRSWSLTRPRHYHVSKPYHMQHLGDAT